MPFRPLLSLSTISVWAAICGSAPVALALGADLTLESDLGQVVELVGVGGVAARAHLIGLAAGGEGLVAPLGRSLDVFLVVALEQAQVADGLRDRGLGVGDAVRVVANELVDHLLRVFRRVQQGVDVRADEGRDTSEDGLLGHAWFLSEGVFESLS
jgi:hypothetical protein